MNFDHKGKPLTKEETKYLLSLVENSKFINNKSTKATSNRLKTEEWVHVTEQFNATSLCRRTPHQLRLKWENLKKSSRKRSATMRMNGLKSGSGPPQHITPDDILDRVSVLLGSTMNRFTVEFGSYAESGFKRTIKNNNDGREARDQTPTADRNIVPALAEYYVAKKKLIEAMLENTMLEKEKLKLEISNIQKNKDNDKK